MDDEGVCFGLSAAPSAGSEHMHAHVQSLDILGANVQEWRRVGQKLKGSVKKISIIIMAAHGVQHGHH